MMDKYTPGPWASLGNQVRAGRFNVVPSVTAGGMGAQPREKHAYACANARLIAAAPELLEALVDAIATVEFERHPLRAWHDSARAAIAKATGDAA